MREGLTYAFLILNKAKDLLLARKLNQSGCPTLATFSFLWLGWETTRAAWDTARKDYSSRNTRIGSTVAARQAGCTVAASAISNTPAAAIP